jgi:hypothetical protein
MPHEEDRIRSIAGYLLKNNARLIMGASPDVVAFVKQAVLQAFADSSSMIRNAAGQDVVAFLGHLEPRNWPECLGMLVELLDSPDAEKQEVCIYSSRVSLLFFLFGLPYGRVTIGLTRSIADVSSLQPDHSPDLLFMAIANLIHLGCVQCSREGMRRLSTQTGR